MTFLQSSRRSRIFHRVLHANLHEITAFWMANFLVRLAGSICNYHFNTQNCCGIFNCTLSARSFYELQMISQTDQKQFAGDENAPVGAFPIPRPARPAARYAWRDDFLKKLTILSFNWNTTVELRAQKTESTQQVHIGLVRTHWSSTRGFQHNVKIHLR